ncbi:hypothetical protein [Costertonia aggregata]|uniref:Lipoprotein n=1 Tax=Costertonia aggregata TaxID=343403 RepID=A0A7H9AMI0_9FLAO|nr:hypothetical protein [Costertonia aggregata]QLG44627.1 hypothetical protein HYG79_04450 [Costertonia aggregata]
MKICLFCYLALALLTFTISCTDKNPKKERKTQKEVISPKNDTPLVPKGPVIEPKTQKPKKDTKSKSTEKKKSKITSDTLRPKTT